MKGFVAAAAVLSTYGISGVAAENVQKPGLFLPASASGHQQTVKNIFLQSYAAYK